MKYCEKCKANVVGTATYCPLCQNKLVITEIKDDEIFPVLPPTKDRYSLLFKVLTFFSLTVSILSITLNFLQPREGWWSILVVGTLGCVWLSVVVAIIKHRNILKYLLYQILIILLFTIFVDYRIGWYGWSITYVLPIIFTGAMIVMYSLSKILKLETGDYMIYLLLDALFGIIPIIFIGSDVVQTDLPSMICIIVSIVSVTALIVFEGRNMYNELKRRLHV